MTRASFVLAQGTWSALQPILGLSILKIQWFIQRNRAKNRKNPRQLAKSGYEQLESHLVVGAIDKRFSPNSAINNHLRLIPRFGVMAQCV